jgi:opacity protein-like surface antigen
MKKIYTLLFFVACAVSGFSQSRFFVGLNGGLDFYSNKYYSKNEYRKFEDGKTDFSAGLDLGYRFSDKARFRLGFNYNEYLFGERPETPGDIVKSEMTLRNLDIIPRLDFRVWSLKKLELFLSPGLRLAYTLEGDEKSFRSNGTISDLHYMNQKYKDKMSGLVGGALLKYNFTKHLGAVLSPDYTFFFDKLYDKNDGNLQRFSVNLGLEWRL